MGDAEAGVGLLAQLFGLLAATSGSVILTALGFVLLFVGVWALSKIFKSGAGQISELLKFIAVSSLVLGIIFSAIGPSIALIYLDNNPIKVVEKEISFSNLEKNSRVAWLIRLIPYYPDTQSYLSVGRLAKLGPPDIEYTFVAPYEELKGQTVERAVEMVGGQIAAKQRVSAIIFSLNQDIVPANARGLMQILQRIERDKAQEIKKKFFQVNQLGKEEEDNLTVFRDRTSWAFQNYKEYYPRFCRLSHNFRCDQSFDARKFISEINSDWHPIGAARVSDRDPCQESPVQYCSAMDWTSLKKGVFSSFGARIFFVKNVGLDELGDRYLIDFGSPSVQRIPEIGLSDRQRR